MLVSTRSRYAMRVLLELAKDSSGEFIPMNTIANKLDISLKYVEHIMPLLCKAGYVKGVHGRGGGYKLDKKPEEMDLFSLLEIIEGDLAPVACLSSRKKEPPCKKDCTILPIWEDFYSKTKSYFEKIHLSDLLNENMGCA